MIERDRQEMEIFKLSSFLFGSKSNVMKTKERERGREIVSEVDEVG